MKILTFSAVFLSVITIPTLIHSMEAMDLVQESVPQPEQSAFTWLGTFLKEGKKKEGSFLSLPPEMSMDVALHMFRKSPLYYWLTNKRLTSLALDRTRKHDHDDRSYLDLDDTAAVFNQDGTRFITIAKDFACFALYDATTGRKIGDSEEYVRMHDAIEGPYRSLLDFAAFTADGRVIVTVSRVDSGPLIWDVGTRSIRHSFADHPDGHGACIEFSAINRAGTRLLTYAGDDNEAKIWDLQALRVVATFTNIFPRPDYNQHNDLCAMVQRWGAGDERRSKIIILDINTGAVKAEIDVGNEHIWSVQLNEKGTELVTTRIPSKNKLVVWDIQTGTILASFEGDYRYAQFVRPGDGVFAVKEKPELGRPHGSASYINLIEGHSLSWSVRCGLDFGFGSDYQGVGVNTTGTQLLITDDTRASLVDRATGKPLHTFENCSSACYDAAATHVLTTSNNEGPSLIWDLESINFLEKFLPTLEQILFLYTIYEIDLANKIRNRRSTTVNQLTQQYKFGLKNALNYLQPVLLDILEKMEKLKSENEWTNLMLDLEKFPHLKTIYLSLPVQIQKIIEPLIMLEQDERPAKRLKIDAE